MTVIGSATENPCAVRICQAAFIRLIRQKWTLPAEQDGQIRWEFKRYDIAKVAQLGLELYDTRLIQIA